MKKTDKTLVLVLRFLKATPFDVLFSGFDGLACFVVLSYPVYARFSLAFYFFNCDCLVYSVSRSVTKKYVVHLYDEESSRRLGIMMSLGKERPLEDNARTKGFGREIPYQKATTQQSYDNRPNASRCDH